MGRKIEYEIERIKIRFVDHAPKAYENGRFAPFFFAAARALATAECMKGVDFKLLLFAISSLDENNHFTIAKTQVAGLIHCSRQAIGNSIKKLIGMKIFCADEDDNGYRLGEFILNARIACWGNTRYIDLKSLPSPIDLDTGEILIPGSFERDNGLMVDSPEDYTW